jgi:methylmalonyl-CoA mutase cobalamin-binding subunit
MADKFKFALAVLLLAAGVARVFHPGTKLSDISDYVREATIRVRAARFPA